MTKRSGWAWPEGLIGLGLLGFAGVVLWQTASIPISPIYAKVGPTIFPYLTAFGLLGLALLLLVQAARGGWQPEEEQAFTPEWRAIAFVVAGLVANVALIVPLGFTAASTLLFVLVTYGFGSRRPVRDALIGFVFAIVAYFGFAKTLSVNIGAGLVEDALEPVWTAIANAVTAPFSGGRS
ncbi:MAG TPA: tripartite tricarboxylate transporter TctB family protein [Beijerinckiaceae bacterium]